MKIRSVIVDDELNCRENLMMIINDYCPELEIVGLADSAQKARELIDVHRPDLVFLDIKMPREDGFQLLQSIPNRKFSVVFTTAYNEYALQAFKADAVDYIEFVSKKKQHILGFALRHELIFQANLAQGRHPH